MSLEPASSTGGKTPGIVIAAFVLSLLGFICGLPALIGLILGIVGRGKAKASGGGVGLATAAIVISALWLAGGLILGVVSIGSSSNSTPSPTPPESPSLEVPAVPGTDSVQDEPAQDDAEPVGETSAEANARGKAQSYLDFSPFSRKGLIDQLEFEGFTTADATYGVDALNVNWNEQAALKAQSYLDMTAFSRSGLIEQLEFEGFSKSEATYGADAVGL